MSQSPPPSPITNEPEIEIGAIDKEITCRNTLFSAEFGISGKQENERGKGKRMLQIKVSEIKYGTDQLRALSLWQTDCCSGRVRLTPHRHYGASAFSTPRDAAL